MINLLPPEEKEQLFLKRAKKLVIILGSIIITSLICLALILFSLKFYIIEKLNDQKSILQVVETKYKTSDFLSYNSLVKKYNKELIDASTFYKKAIYLSDAIKTILDIKRPNGLFFLDMSIKNNEKDNKVKVTLSGMSNTRDNLLTFEDNIKNSNKIENVYFPPNSWINTKNINFYVTFDVIHD